MRRYRLSKRPVLLLYGTEIHRSHSELECSLDSATECECESESESEADALDITDNGY